MMKSWECVFLQRWVNHPVSLSQAHAKAETMALRKKKAFQHESSHCQKDILSLPSEAKAAMYYAPYRSNGGW